MKKLITALFAFCLISLPAAAEEFALHKAVPEFAHEVDASRSVSRGTNEFNETWQVTKYTFSPCDIVMLEPLVEAYNKDIDNKNVTLAIQQSAPFAYSIEYNQTDQPVRLNSENYENILLIAGRENKNDYQTIVAVVWSDPEGKFQETFDSLPETTALAKGEMYIIYRDLTFAAWHNNFSVPQPQTTNDNLLRLKFYAETYQAHNNYLQGGNIVQATALVVPEIAKSGSQADIEAAQNYLAAMIAVTPASNAYPMWKQELETSANTLLNLMQLLSSGTSASQYQASPDTFVINGTIDQGLWDIGYYIYNSGNTLTVNTASSDVISIYGGKFNYQTELTGVTIGRLQALMKDGTVCSAYIQFPFVPGQTATLTVHNGWFTLTGPGFYDQYTAAISISSPERLYAYALEHSDEPGAVTAAFYSQKLTRDQLQELYDLLPNKYKSSAIGTFLRRFF